jgi:hypothetical protein
MAHLEKAKDKILMGAERKLFLSEEEKRITAIHESGHTLVAKLTPGADPIHKVTIIPRGQALGATQQLPETDRYHYGRNYLMSRIAVSLGGRAAEKAVFGEVSTGAQNDLKQVSDLAEKMVCQWGMSDKIGPIAFNRGEEHPFLGRRLATEKTFSEEMAWLIDQEIEKIVKKGEEVADKLIAEHPEAGGRSAGGRVTPRDGRAIPSAKATTIGTTGGCRPLTVFRVLLAGVGEEIVLGAVDAGSLLPILLREALAEESPDLEIGVNPRNNHYEHSEKETPEGNVGHGNAVERANPKIEGDGRGAIPTREQHDKKENHQDSRTSDQPRHASATARRDPMSSPRKVAPVVSTSSTSKYSPIRVASAGKATILFRRVLPRS